MPGALEKAGEVGASTREERPDRFRCGTENPGNLQGRHVVLPAKRHGNASPFGKGGDGPTDRLGELFSLQRELLIHWRCAHHHRIELMYSGSLLAESGRMSPCPDTDGPRYDSLVPKVIECQMPNRGV
jgi:hypothetical protein